jgi:hypothetical protein
LSRANLVTLLSDFGLRDTYVAQMKAVVLGLNPDARLVDLTHEVAPGDILEAALFLEGVYSRFPEGSVHLAVVDPGVGSQRLPLALEAAGYFFVGPDNGLFTAVLAAHPEAKAYRVRQGFRREVSATFHGRDIFAPAAALLALGRREEVLGEPVAECVRLQLPEVKPGAATAAGEVIRVDRFGNLITNLRPKHLEGERVGRVRVKGWAGEGIKRTYSDVPQGQCLALWSSSGHLEVACRGASAAHMLGLGVGEPVIVEFAGLDVHGLVEDD